MGRNKDSMLIVLGWIVVGRMLSKMQLCIILVLRVSQVGYHVGGSDNKDIINQVYFDQSSKDVDMMHKGFKQARDPIQKGPIQQRHNPKYKIMPKKKKMKRR